MDWFDLWNYGNEATPAAIPSGSYNLEPDYYVTDKGNLLSTAGETGTFQSGQWIPSSATPNTQLNTDWLSQALNAVKGVGGKALDFATSRGGMAGIAALLAMLDRKKEEGGGVRYAYAGPRQMTRTMTQGRYGPIARYAAQGGLMQAYAQGGPVRMEDGGFVLTKRAVDGAGGPQGIAQLFPGSRMIRGPGTGTSDDIPATIHGPHGVTPAKVSNGEAYVPKHVVQQAGGSPAMYDAMHKLQRRA